MPRSLEECLLQGKKSRKSVLSVCLSPGIQHTYVLDGFLSNEVNRAKHSFLDAAGKGINVCRTLTQLGIPNMHLSQGGSNGSGLEALARQEGIKLALVPSSLPLRTCSTLVVLKPDQDIPDACSLDRALAEGNLEVESVTEIVEEASTVDPEVGNRLQAEFDSLLPHTSLVCISGSRANGFDAEMVAGLVRSAHEHAVPVFLDVRAGDLLAALREEPAMVKINLEEFLLTFIPKHAKLYATLDSKNSTEHLEEVKEVLADLTEYGNTGFVITRGPRHVLVASGGEVKEVTVPRLAASHIVNPIGSGDSFLAGMAAVWNGTEERELQDESLRCILRAVEMGVRCGQASARTLRPAHLPPGFVDELPAVKGRNKQA